MDVATILQTITTSIGIARAVAEAQTEFDRADLKLKMAEVVNALADAKLALTEIRDEQREKDAELARMREAFQRKGETIEYDGRHYRTDADGRPTGRPFCSVCFEQGVLFLLDRAQGPRGTMSCARCKSVVSYVPEFYPKSE